MKAPRTQERENKKLRDTLQKRTTELERKKRELEIEAALERVRTRAMAMHRSDELVDVARILRHEMGLLGVEELETSSIYIHNKETGETECWFSIQDRGNQKKLVSDHMIMDLGKTWVGRQMLEFQASRKKKTSIVMKGARRVEWIRYCAEKSARFSAKGFYGKKIPERTYHLYKFANGFMGAAAPGDISAESWNLLKRATEVFSLAYTRFSDILKAEAQAREAEIQLALERVRARTMAMHQSEELAAVASVLFHQLQELGLPSLRRCLIGIVDEQKGRLQSWHTSLHGDSTQRVLDYPIDEHPVIRKKVKGWRKKKPFSINLAPKELKDFIRYIVKHGFAYTKGEKPATRLIQNHVPFTYGYLEVATHEPLPAEDLALLQRFATVFEQTYTRFLDLQKAEAQARESEIQLALERVRARTMAMHSSEELLDVITILSGQLSHLGIKFGNVSFGTNNQDYDMQLWMAVKGQPKAYRIQWTFIDNPGVTRLKEAQKNPDLVFADVLTHEETNEWMQHIFNCNPSLDIFSPEKRARLMSTPGYARSIVVMKDIFLVIGNYALTPYTNEENAILKGFARVFEQAYVRFVDLQKAEAQAREAQIEAALEKVRSRSLAMHKAEELGEVATVVFEKLRELDLPVDDGVAIVTHVDGSKDQVEWMENPGMPSAMKFFQPYHKHPILDDYWQAKEKGLDFIAPKYTAEQSRSFFNHIFEHTDYKNTPQEIKDYCLAAETYSYFAAFQKNSSIFINDYSGKSLSDAEINIIKRFSKVFEQAYTRFLDLQKAEAQAREAQIEAALERVRSRTIGMQKSEELKDVIKVVYEQLVHVNIRLDHAGFVVNYTPKGDWTFWIADEQDIPSKISHPYFDSVWASQFEEAKRTGTDYFETNLDFEEKNKFYQELLSYVPGLSDKARGFYLNCPGLAATTVLFPDVSLYIENFSGTPYTTEENKILLRFGKVFQQTYTRFLDLQKAEAQAREAKIEAALERVRSRSIAMRKSEEITEIAAKIFTELRQLDLALNRVLIWTFNDPEQYTTWWSANPEVEGAVESYRINYNDTPVFQNYLKAWREREPVYLFTLSGATKKTWEDHLFEHTELSRLPMAVRQGMRGEDTLHTISVIGDYGLLMSGSLVPLPETSIDIIQRFGRVFQQSYTRYLDVQKAEAQAREAQIEAALERIRSRSLAMHHSSELSSVVDTLLQEFTKLDFTLTFCIINLIDEEDHSNTVWAANPETGKDAESYYMKFEDYPFHHAMWNAWKEQKKNFIYTIEGEEKKIYDEYLFTKTEFRRFPKHVQEANKALKRYVAGFTFFKYSGLQTVSENFISEEDLAILERFGRVFEQTYTRFLDLKKSEAQAREAEIQLALERVRARTMAMQQSDELLETASLLFEQVKSLGCKPFSVGFVLLDKSKPDGEFFMSADGKFQPSVLIPNHDESAESNMYLHWTKGEQLYTQDGAGEELQQHFEYLMSLPGKTGDMFRGMHAAGIRFPQWQRWHAAYFEQGYLLFITREPFKETDIFIRFAAAFEQTYTRFLDLQKSEAQARESEIQLGLERVRARAMAMQSSQELKELIGTLFTELTRLDLVLTRCIIMIYDLETKGSMWWMANSEEPSHPRGFYVQYHEYPAYLAFVEAWQKRERKWQYILEGSDKREWDGFIFSETELRSLPSYVIDGMKAPERVYLSSSFNSFGNINLASLEPLSEEHFDILLRFAKVFDLTYTRFNDLKKAEAQAREAQIEVSLERVRSKAMAMHNSADLSSAASIVFTELRKLGLNPFRSGISLHNRDNRKNLLYAATQTATGDELSVVGWALLDHHPVLSEIYDSWAIGKDYFPVLKGGLLQSYYEIIAPTFNVPVEQSRVEQYGYFIAFTQGSLYGWAKEPVDEDQKRILKRFASVVDLTFKRYFDLQKAEAQAREAEIQLALERVRARTMAMHNSEELSDTVAILFQQLSALGNTPERINICLLKEEAGVMEVWSTEQGGKKIDHSFNASVQEPTTVAKVYKGWKEKKKSMVIDLTGKELDDWIRYLKEVIQLPFKEELRQDRRVHTVAFFSNGALLLSTPEPVPAETVSLLNRFAEVFNLTYRRFLDLQKAEAQAREAQVEAAIEKVRARAMAMQKSEELKEVVQTLSAEIRKLDVVFTRTFIVIYESETMASTWWMSNPDTNESFGLYVKYHELTPYRAHIDAWRERRKAWEYILEGDDKKQWDQFLFNETDLSMLPERVKKSMREQEKVCLSCSFSNFGYLVLESKASISDDQFDILHRFARVFDLTYTRFLDIQKAEAQAREAQVEAALEKVRSRSLAMHKSSELQDVVNTVFERLRALDIDMNVASIFVFREGSKDWEQWVASSDTDYSSYFHLPYTDNRIFNDLEHARQSGKDFYSVRYSREEKDKWFRYAFAETEYSRIPESRKQFLLESEFYQVSFALSKHIGLQLAKYSGEDFSASENDILKRLARVFEQAYVRFLDLQKAEAQAREAQVEAALERIRSRTMGMQRSDELADVASLLFEQIGELGIRVWTAGFNVWLDNDNAYQDWITSPTGGFIEPYNVDTTQFPVFIEVREAKQRGDEFFVQYVEGDMIEAMYRELSKFAPRQFEIMLRDGFEFPKHQYDHFVFGSSVSLMFITFDPMPEAHDIFKRFGKVFEQTYTRFLDLQKAEAQAREAQIEAAMERIRSRALAMREPEEIKEVITEIRRQIDELGQLDLEASVVHIYPEDVDMFESFAAVRPPGESGHIVVAHVKFPVNATDRIKYMIEMYRSDQPEYTIEFDKAMAEEWQQVLMEYAPMIAERRVGFVNNRRLSDRTEFWNFADFSGGSLLLVTHSPASEDTKTILRKAAQVFDLAYKRYLDLQKAEASSKEAIKQAALDRIRADIASMRSVGDLDRITPLIWNELTTLGIPFMRCGVFIMDKGEEQIHTFLSTPDGRGIAAFHLPFDTPGKTRLILENWLQHKSYTDRWDDADFLTMADLLVEQGVINTTDQYMGSIPRGGFFLHFFPFLQGMLYVGSMEQLDEERKDLVQSVAQAFSTAYARYEDFNKLEAAKTQVDKTLSELQAAQKQLVQSEKMASLGELTAGIAHEIQNPLNFVNNFSDVSHELLEEMKQALEQGNSEEAITLATDIRDNLQKILFHGKRADGIVKGMLQHSRTSSGQRESTDINQLCDEYLRLAYHGLRAKDKSFSAGFTTAFDPNLPRTEVVPQDIGRVLLNLINNAFYAVSAKASDFAQASPEQAASVETGYQPMVTVSTARVKDKVEIMVEDNGGGIPKAIKEKIFQPFFTTKPTGQGTGLGLSLSYDIVRAHGGDIKVDTKEGEGTTFTIDLPA